MIYKRNWLILAFPLVSTLTFAKNRPLQPRVIRLSGHIVDAKSIKPLASPDIFKGNGPVLGSTNQLSYHEIALE
jgi:hypothetical protein